MLRLLIFIPIFLLSQETFTLPDEADHLMHQLNTRLKASNKTVYLSTAYLDDYLLIKNLKKLAKRGVKINIITQSIINKQNKVLALTLHQNINIHTLKSPNSFYELKGSAVCIDDNDFFLFGTDLDRKKNKNTYSFVHYSIQKCEELFKKLLSRTEVY